MWYKETLKKKLSHLTKKEKAGRMLLKTLSDTLKCLKETPGGEARKQIQIILAAISHHRWGTPLLDGHSSWQLDTQAREMKVKLMTGEDKILTPPSKKIRDMYPPQVKHMAKKHWEETTIPEPAVNRRMKRKEKELKEGN